MCAAIQRIRRDHLEVASPKWPGYRNSWQESWSRCHHESHCAPVGRQVRIAYWMTISKTRNNALEPHDEPKAQDTILWIYFSNFKYPYTVNIINYNSYVNAITLTFYIFCHFKYYIIAYWSEDWTLICITMSSCCRRSSTAGGELPPKSIFYHWSAVAIATKISRHSYYVIWVAK